MLSQTSNETSIPNEDLKKVLIAAENGKAALEKIVVLNSVIADMNGRIENFKNIIAEYQSKDSVYSNIINGYEKEVANLEEQKETLTKWVQSLEKQLKKEKRKRLWTAIAGVVGIGLTAYLTTQ